MRLTFNSKYFSFQIGNKVKVKLFTDIYGSVPTYATEGSAGIDIRAGIHTPMYIPVGAIKLIPTNLYMEIPKGYELQIRPRSGLSLKVGLSQANCTGTIDSDYRGNIGMIAHNIGNDTININPGDRICQGILAKYEQIEFVAVSSKEELSLTKRGEGGYGHTGTNKIKDK
jgi:dUTP pyrophosphatase